MNVEVQEWEPLKGYAVLSLLRDPDDDRVYRVLCPEHPTRDCGAIWTSGYLPPHLVALDRPDRMKPA